MDGSDLFDVLRLLQLLELSNQREDQLSTSGILRCVNESCNRLKRLTNLSDLSELKKILDVINAIYHEYTNLRTTIISLMIKGDFFLSMATIFGNLKSAGYFCSNDNWECTKSCYHVLWNWCDCCAEVGQEFLKTNLPDTLIWNVTNKSHLNNLDNFMTKDLIVATVSIIHNIARYPGNNTRFKRKDVKESLIILIKHFKTETIGICSMLCLAYLIDDSESDLLTKGIDSVSALVDLTRRVQSNSEGRHDGFTLWELLSGLNALSCNENIRTAIARNNGLEIIVKVLKQQKSTEEEIEFTWKIIRNFCFDKALYDTLVLNYDLKEHLQRFSKHNNVNIRDVCDRIQWFIGNKYEKKPETIKRTSVSQKTIYVSYSKEDENMVMEIFDELMIKGIRIWQKADHRGLSSIDFMANGIESSPIFIMALSENYKNDSDCRSEVEYAHKLRKNIIPLLLQNGFECSGWLGFIVGSKVPIDFGLRKYFRSSIDVLVQKINSSFSQAEATMPVETIQPRTAWVESSGKVESNNCVPLIRWTNVDIRGWMAKEKMENLFGYFENLDGQTLNLLLQDFNKDPQSLKHKLRQKYDLSFLEVLQFVEALKGLNRRIL